MHTPPQPTRLRAAEKPRCVAARRTFQRSRQARAESMPPQFCPSASCRRRYFSEMARYEKIAGRAAPPNLLVPYLKDLCPTIALTPLQALPLDGRLARKIERSY